MHLLHAVDNAGEEIAQHTAMHRRTPLAQQPGTQKCLLQDQAGDSAYRAARHDNMLLPSAFAQEPEG